LRSFLGWLHKRGKIRSIPNFPWPKVDEYEPRILSIEDQDRILDAIDEPARGIFLAPGRVRAGVAGIPRAFGRALDAPLCTLLRARLDLRAPAQAAASR